LASSRHPLESRSTEKPAPALAPGGVPAGGDVALFGLGAMVQGLPGACREHRKPGARGERPEGRFTKR
jgi:hypothetical protein